MSHSTLFKVTFGPHSLLSPQVCFERKGNVRSLENTFLTDTSSGLGDKPQSSHGQVKIVIRVQINLLLAESPVDKHVHWRVVIFTANCCRGYKITHKKDAWDGFEKYVYWKLNLCSHRQHQIWVHPPSLSLSLSTAHSLTHTFHLSDTNGRMQHVDCTLNSALGHFSVHQSFLTTCCFHLFVGNEGPGSSMLLLGTHWKS